MKKPKTEQPTQPTVAQAEATLQRLLAKREELVASRAELEVAKKSAAFASFTDSDGDHLASVVRSLRSADADIESLDLAIHEARNRIAIAEGYERQAAAEANAAKVLETCDALEKAGRELGDAAKTFAESSRQVSSLLQQLHSYGISSPSAEQYRIFGSAALRTMIAGSVWAREYRPIAPGERKTFDGLIGGWTQGVRARVRGQLGAKEEAA